MSLMSEWNDYVDHMTDYNLDEFKEKYYAREEDLYKVILAQHGTPITGKFSELVEQYNFEPLFFTGFMEGINTSLKKPMDLDKLRTNSAINLDVDFEKLYFNMLEAKASWLYGLKEWEDVLSEERRKEITKEHRLSKQAVSHKIDRNAPCPCGSGKKYKKCCGANV